MADKSLFGRLKKLFSTQVVVRRTKDNRLKVVDSSRLQSTGNRRSSNGYDRYTRLHGGRTNWATYNERFNYHSNKLNLYTDYEAMDKDSIVASILDIYSDECTLYNDDGDVLTITSSDEKIKKLLHNLFYDILNIEFNLWSWIRGMNKYGDYFLYLDIQDEYGIVNVSPVSAYSVTREEGYDPDNPYSVRFKIDNTHRVMHGDDKHRYFENYEIAHFRLMTDSNFLPYGRSMLEPARKTWKQLTLMEDAMLIHRIMRAPEKRIFKIDVGTIPAAELDTYMENLINRVKKTPFVDPQSGEYNLKFNMQNMIEDFYLPVRNGAGGTEIDTLSGMEWTGIDDIEYLKNRMLAAFKVPKAFIGYEEGVEGKATLAQQDIRFARSIERVQKMVISELRKVAIIHLFAHGYEDASLLDFELGLNTPSVIYQQEKLEMLTTQAGLVRDMKDLRMFSQQWMYENIFNLSKDEWKREQAKVIKDLKLEFRQEQITTEGNDPTVTGETFGTPHDLATANQNEPELPEGGSPEGGWEGAGRPKETGKKGTDDASMGRDPLGNKSIDVKAEKPTPEKRKPAREDVDRIIGNMPRRRKVKTKKMIMDSLISEENETPKSDSNLLDENNIMDLDK